VYELGMIANYKLRTGDFFSDAALGLQMLRRGKLSFLPSRIQGAREVRGFFRRKSR
jgi:heterodisulfide reductase subunit C